MGLIDKATKHEKNSQWRTDSMVAIITPGIGSSLPEDEDGDDGADPSAVCAPDDGMGSMRSAVPGTYTPCELHVGYLDFLAEFAGPDRYVASGLEHRPRAEAAVRAVPVAELLRLLGLYPRPDPVDPKAL